MINCSDIFAEEKNSVVLRELLSVGVGIGSAVKFYNLTRIINSILAMHIQKLFW